MLIQSKSEGRYEKDINLNFEFKEGSPVDVILKTVEEENIDLVVMGTSGKKAWIDFYLEV